MCYFARATDHTVFGNYRHFKGYVPMVNMRDAAKLLALDLVESYVMLVSPASHGQKAKRRGRKIIWLDKSGFCVSLECICSTCKSNEIFHVAIFAWFSDCLYEELWPDHEIKADEFALIWLALPRSWCQTVVLPLLPLIFAHLIFAHEKPAGWRD